MPVIATKTCPVCGVEFTRSYDSKRILARRKYCGKACALKYIKSTYNYQPPYTSIKENIRD